MNIYVHIPFCRSKCAYCGFLSHCDIKYVNKYIEALFIELGKRFGSAINDKVTSVYFGGGTPSLIDPIDIERIILKIREQAEFIKSPEITLEVNPEDVTSSSLIKWKRSGVNRLSIGVQTFNNEVRAKMGRSLDRSEVIDKLKLAKKNFKNVGVDLIAGLPGDDFNTLKYGINIISDLGINHISLYDLEISNDSDLFKHPGRYSFKTEDEKTDFLLKSWKLLSEVGFRQYEISNFSRKDEFCRHNLDFWRGKDYIGLGLGAVSRMGNRVIRNTKEYEKYLNLDLGQRVEEMSDEEEVSLELSMALRLDFPITKAVKNYEKVFCTSLKKKLESLARSDFYDQESKTLTPKGRLVHNSVTEFLLEASKY